MRGLAYICASSTDNSKNSMAIVTGNIIGDYTQSAANVTFTKWKGIQVMKKKAEIVSNPQSVGQMTQRNRLSAITFYNSWFRAMYLAGFAKLAIRKSEYNVFSSRNIMSATQADETMVRHLVLSNLQLSSGNTGNPTVVSAQNSGGEIKIEWDPTPVFPTDSANDLVYACAVIQPAGTELTREAIVGTITSSIGDAQRGSGQVQFPAPDNISAGTTVWTYLFFFNPFTKEASNTIVTTFTF